MNNKKVLFLLLGVTIFFTFFSGTIRNDVNEKKYIKLASEKQFDCVGQIYKDSSASGACVLISDRFVLTAAKLLIKCDSRPDTTYFDNGLKGVLYVPYNHRVADASEIYLKFNGQRFNVKSIVLHPYYLDSITKGTCDIALLELEKPIKSIKPTKINTVFNENNSNVVGVGYGASGPADRPDLVGLKNKKIAGENVVDSIGGLEYLSKSTLLFCDFDHPTRKDCNKLGSATPRPLEYICMFGDSGGGLFRRNNNDWELIGICSDIDVDIDQLIQSGYYGQTMEWTRVSVFANWISQQTR